MKIVPRSGWSARAPKTPPQHISPSARRYFVVHHSGASSAQPVRAIQDWCMDGRGFADIDYNFLVDQQGTVFEGRGWDVIGSHALGYNSTGIGVCVIGDDELSDAAKRSLIRLYHAANGRCAQTLKVRGHGQLTATACPGTKISMWLQAGMPAPPDPAEEAPMSLSAKDIVEAPVKITDSCAHRLGMKPGSVYRLDLLVQQAVIAAADADRQTGEVAELLKAVAERLAAVEAQLERLAGQGPA